MLSVDWWRWKCSRCDFKAMDKFTVNPQQCNAQAIVSLHKWAHDEQEAIDAVDPVPARSVDPSTREP